MDENQKTTKSEVTTGTVNSSDDALFASLAKKKKKRRRKIITTVIIIILVLAIGLTAGVFYLRRKVTKQFQASIGDVQSYEATVGSISTTVSGSGTLAAVDQETIKVPANVEIEKVMVTANQNVSEGDIIAKVDLSTVMTAMNTVQGELDSIDEEIYSAESTAVSSYVTAGVNGRVKEIYAAAGDDVSTVMYNNGALAVLSLDGTMAVDVTTTEGLSAGDSVTVTRADGSTIAGEVECITGNEATILVTDNGPENGEEVSVATSDGKSLGTGSLYIHSALKVTGYAGTVSQVYTTLNSQVYSTTTLFTLTNTATSAKYRALLQDREEYQDTLQELISLYRTGAVIAQYDGSIDSVIYDEDTGITADTETELVTMSPNESMSVTISVDETNILSLEVGQNADVTISSIDSDRTFDGTVTEISKTATSSSGVTRYSATITMDKDEQMIAGMSAKVVVRIEGVDNAIIIPIDALHQTSSTSYVYTSYDEETQQFGGKVEVTTGISNSNYVEITSGLKEGDTVYYVESEDDNPFAMMGDFGGGMSSGDFSGGDMPSGNFGGGNGGGGNMPSGDFGGGNGGGGMPSGGRGRN